MPEKMSDTAAAPVAANQAQNESPVAAAREPLSVRAGTAGARRRKRETLFRGLDDGKDETNASLLFFNLFVFSIRFILKILGIYGRGVRNTRKLQLVHRDIFLPDLPEAFEGFQILHISDFHFPRRFPAFSKAVAALLDGLEVDMCALTGDFRYGYFGPIDHVPVQMRAALKGVTSRYGVYAVLGNHDRFVTGELLESAGVTVLYNEGVLIEKAGNALWVAGIDDPHFYRCDDLDAALRERPENTSAVLLAHSPERVSQAAAKGVNLYLAGHTHGGQIRFPVIGALVSNSRCARNQIWGAWHCNGMAGYTTAGIGATDVPVRFNCPPEAALLTLRKATTEE